MGWQAGHCDDASGCRWLVVSVAVGRAVESVSASVPILTLSTADIEAAPHAKAANAPQCEPL